MLPAIVAMRRAGLRSPDLRPAAPRRGLRQFACLRQLGTTAALAVDERRERGDELAGVHAAPEVLGHRAQQRGLAVDLGREHDHARAELVAQGIGGAAQGLAGRADVTPL
ncbi:MAG: hypothetical protein U0168_25350 [Nannocystaceae bacterium]